MTCRARQFSDQMSCAPCGLTWDTNDPDRPPCGPTHYEPEAAWADHHTVDPDFDAFDPDDIPHTLLMDLR